MSIHKSSLWCVAKECNVVAKKRHFFLFPKEHNRWLQWIHACGRHDLEVMSPEYAHRNYRLCHLHFEEKWYKVGKCRAYLQPDAVPTIFFGRNNIPVTTASEEDVERAEKDSRQEETNSDPVPTTQFSAQSSKTILPMDTDWTMNADIAKPSTSSSTHFVTIQETPRKKKLKQRNLKLKTENKMLRERIRRLQKKVKNLESIKGTTEESKEHETLRQLGCKLFPSNFAQFLSVQIDAQIKSKHGRRYSIEFKQLALR